MKAIETKAALGAVSRILETWFAGRCADCGCLVDALPCGFCEVEVQ